MGGGAVWAGGWRGSGVGRDLVARVGGVVIFSEVEHTKSHGWGAGGLGPRQMARIYGAASEFIGGEPAGQLTPVRFDVALVDGRGQIEILENAFAA